MTGIAGQRTQDPELGYRQFDRGAAPRHLEALRVEAQPTAIELTVTEFWILHALARYPGHVKNRESLMREANMVVDDHTVTSYLKRMRRKFEAVDPAFDAIETVYGLGYRFVERGG